MIKLKLQSNTKGEGGVAKPWFFHVVEQKIHPALYLTIKQKKTKEWEGVAKPTYSPDTEPKIHHLHSIKLTLDVKKWSGRGQLFFLIAMRGPLWSRQIKNTCSLQV